MKISIGDKLTITKTDRLTSFLEIGEEVEAIETQTCERKNKVICVRRKKTDSLVNVLMSQVAHVIQ